MGARRGRTPGRGAGRTAGRRRSPISPPKRSALERAGFGVQRTGAGRTLPHFTCLVPAGVSPHEQIAVLLQKQFCDVGVNMAIEPVPIPQMVGRLAAGDFDTVLLDLNGGPSLARLYTFWHSSGAAFYGDFGYGGADGALDALRAAQDAEQPAGRPSCTCRTCFTTILRPSFSRGRKPPAPPGASRLNIPKRQRPAPEYPAMAGPGRPLRAQ